MSHDDFQPPEHEEPAKDDDDRMYGALSDLASIDTHDVNLRDHPKAYEVLDRLMTHAYAEGRADQAREHAERARQGAGMALSPACAAECQQAVDYGVNGQYHCSPVCVYLAAGRIA